MWRWIKAALAATTLLALTIGVPVALVALVGNPLPGKTPDLSNMRVMLEQGNIPAEVVINTIAVFVWFAWAQLAWAVAWEAIVNAPRVMSGRRWRPAPMVATPVGDGVARLFATMLAVGAFVASTPSPALATTHTSAGVDWTDTVAVTAPLDTADTTAAAVERPVWEVVASDDLWSIAETTLGDGSRVDEIIVLNPGLTARNLRVGMRLELPATATVSTESAATESASPAAPHVADDASVPVSYVVQDNDGWWNIAEALWGDGSQHAELRELMVGQEVAPGVVFTADTWTIHPGWVFTLPADDASVPADDGIVTVERGDTLWDIAADELGDPDRWPEIFDESAGEVMNDGRVFDDPNLIQPGWELPVPTGPAIDAPAPERAAVDDAQADPDIDITDHDAAPDADADIEVADTDVDVTTDPDIDPVIAAADTITDADAEADVAVVDVGVMPGVPAGGARPAEVVEVPAANDPAAESAPQPAGAEVAGLSAARDWRPVWVAGIAGGGALATGLWQLSRRLRRRAAARGGGVVASTASQDSRIDDAIRSAADVRLVSWANRELGDLVRARGINDRSALPMVVSLGEHAGLAVQWEPPLPSTPVDGWRVDADGVQWSQPLPDRAVSVESGPVAIPGLVTFGRRNGDQVLVDVESCGSITVHGDMAAAESLVRSIVLEFGVGGVVSNAQVHTVGLDVDGTETLDRVRARSERDALEHLRSIRVQHDEILDRSERSSMLELRSASSPQGREITVVVVRADGCAHLDELIEAALPQRGVALIVVGEASCATSVVVNEDRTAVISPIGLVVEAAEMPRQTAATVAVHMDRLHSAVDAREVAAPAPVEHAVTPTVVDTPTHVVRVLGTPRLDDAHDLGWQEMEILSFCAATNEGATTDSEIVSAVFCDRVTRSDVWDLVGSIRASCPTVLAPRTEGGSEIALGDGVVSDVQLMGQLAARSHSVDDTSAVTLLVEGLALVSGVPYSAAAGLDWAETSGAMSAAYQIIERSSHLLVDRAAAAGRVDDARVTLREVLEALGTNEPVSQALMRLERSIGADSAAEHVLGDLTRDLAFLGDGSTSPTPAPGTTLLLTRTDTVQQPAAAVAVERATMLRPRVLLRTFGEVAIEGSTSTGAVPAVYAVAAAGRPVLLADIAAATGYSAKSLSNAFTTSNDLIERADSMLALRPGVRTDHAWMIECASLAATSDEADDPIEAIEWLRTLFSDLIKIDGKAFATRPGKKVYWEWVGDYPADLPALDVAESNIVEAALRGVQVWQHAEAADAIPADVVVRACCQLARHVPYAMIPGGLRPSSIHTSAEALIVAAHTAANSSGELTGQVIDTARRLIADKVLEASDEFADELGLD